MYVCTTHGCTSNSSQGSFPGFGAEGDLFESATNITSVHYNFPLAKTGCVERSAEYRQGSGSQMEEIPNVEQTIERTPERRVDRVNWAYRLWQDHIHVRLLPRSGLTGCFNALGIIRNSKHSASVHIVTTNGRTSTGCEPV